MKKKILIIEDDPVICQVYDKRLSQHYEVSIVQNGNDGIEQSYKWNPDLIILDLILPGELSGMRTLMQLKEHQETTSIPVLVLTNLEGQTQTVLEAGAMDCLVKTSTSIEQVEHVISEHFKKAKS